MVASRWVWGLLGIVAILSVTGTTTAQTPPSIIALEPVDIEGELTTEDESLDNETFYDIYIFEGSEGELIDIELSSDAFDTYLTVFDAEGNKIAENDDFDTGQNSRVVIELLTTGIHKIYANSYEKQAIGNYQLSWQNATETALREAEAARLVNEAVKLYQQETKEGYQQAIIKFQKVLIIYKVLDNQSKESEILRNIGVVYDWLNEKQKALDYYQQSLVIYRTLDDQHGEAETLNYIGVVYNWLNEKQKALDYYQQSLVVYRALDDRHREAETLNYIGNAYSAFGEKQQALDYYQQALSLSRAVGDRSGEASTLKNIGVVYSNLGGKQQALDYYQQALPLSRAVGDRGKEASILNNIGRVYDDLGEKQQALDYYGQALPLRRAVGDRRGEASTLNNIGRVYDDLGEKQQALDYYAQALPLRKAVGDRSGEASTLNNIGMVYSNLGEKQQALDYYQQALPLFRAVGDHNNEATTLNNIGLFYSDLGENQQALDYYQQALPLSRAVGDRRQEATTLHNIGGVYSNLGENQQALDYYQQALPLSRAVGDRRQEAITLDNVGQVYLDQGNYTEALKYFEQALPISQKVGDRTGEGENFRNIGQMYYFLENYNLALEYYQKSLPLSRAVGDRSQEAKTLYNVAYLEKNRGNLEKALPPMQQSIAILEDLRTKVASPELRQTYFSTVQIYYQLYLDLLMDLHQKNPDQGYDKQAFEVSEKSRARTLLELLTEANIDIKEGISPVLHQQEQDLSQKLDQSEQKRLTIFSKNNSTDAEKAAINQTLDELTAQSKQLQDEIRRSSPQYAAFKYPQPITVEQLQNTVLDQDTVLLQYAIGEDKSYLWVITKDSFNSYELPNKTELTKLINNVRRQITDASKDDFPPPIRKKFEQDRIIAIQQLSEQILQPATAQLNKKRILVVPDGELYALPFSVLSLSTSNYEPLASQHEIINLPSSSTLAILRQNTIKPISNNPSFAIFADPVFKADDCRITQSPNCDQERLIASKRAAQELDYVNWDPLPGTYTEAKNILNLFPAQAKTSSAFGFAAQRDKVIGNQLENYNLIHFATHGFFDEAKPDQSGVVFSLIDETGKPENGFLRLDSIFNMKLNADLVVLSACQTGLGEDIKGEGMVGLSRGFMYAGTPRLLMSLWSVDDAATAEFMTRFYRLLLNEKLTPAAALKETQRQMREETQWIHPYYWAAFILQGDWN